MSIKYCVCKSRCVNVNREGGVSVSVPVCLLFSSCA